MVWRTALEYGGSDSPSGQDGPNQRTKNHGDYLGGWNGRKKPGEHRDERAGGKSLGVRLVAIKKCTVKVGFEEEK